MVKKGLLDWAREHAIDIAVSNGVSALFAFIKDVLLASVFGTSLYGDAFALGLIVPDVIGNNMVGLAVNSALVPTWTMRFQGREAAFRKILLPALVICFVVMAVVTFSVWYGRYQIVDLLTGSAVAGLFNGTMVVFSYLWPLMILYPLAYLVSAALQATGRAARAATGPVLLNAVSAIAMLSLWLSHLKPEQSLRVVSMIWVITPLLMLLYLGYSFVSGRGGTRMPVASLETVAQYAEAGEKQPSTMRYVMALLIFQLCAQLVLLVERGLASRSPEGTVAALTYAYRIAQSPQWIYVAALGMAMLPQMTRAVTRSASEVQSIWRKAFKRLLIVSLPSMIFLEVMGQPVIAVLLQHGAFTSDSVRMTSTLLAGYALAIVGQSITWLGFRVFLAQRKVRLPVLLYLLTTGVNIALDVELVHMWGAVGIGVGSAISAVISGVWTLLLVRRQIGWRIREDVSGICRIMYSSLGFFVLVYGEQRLSQWYGFSLITTVKWLWVLLIGTTGIGLYVWLLRIWKVEIHT